MNILRIASPTALFIFLFVLVLFVPVPSVAVEQKGTISKKELKVLLITARTPADYRRIANFYQQEARRLIEKSKYHERMAAVYQNNPLPYEGKFPYGSIGLSHCRYWTRLYAEQAKEADLFGAIHDDMAGAAEQNQQ